MKRFLSVLCIVALLAVFVLPVGAFASTVGYIKASNGGKVNVRSSMVTGASNVIDKLPTGTGVVILKTVNEWSYIRFKATNTGTTTRGYVLSKYIREGYDTAGTTDNIKACSTKNATVQPSANSRYVNLRQQPSTYGNVLVKCHAGYKLKITGLGTTWAKVYDPKTGKSGYMMKKFLKY